MSTKFARFDLEWWVVQKRMVYIIVTASLVALLSAGTSLYVWKYGNPLKRLDTALSATAGARFISFEGDVRVIRAATRETITASLQTQLMPGDTIQTQADGRARISLADGSTLVVRPNSTVIIRENARIESEQRTHVRVMVDNGGINVRTEEQAEGTTSVVETPKTQNRLAPLTGVNFAVNPDKTEEIRVNSGEVQTTTSSGETTVIRNNEYVAVNQSGSVTKREHLLDVPTPTSPRDLEKVFVGTSGAASIALRWQRPASGTPAHYRVEVATSPFFVPTGRVIERDQLVATEFNATDLRPGAYFWHVRATAPSGQDSDWTEPQKFIVAPRGTGEQVSVNNFTPEYVGGNVFLIRGQAPPGTTIRASGREALAAADGSFQLQISAPETAREVAVEAEDQQGNRSQYKVPLPPRNARK